MTRTLKCFALLLSTLVLILVYELFIMDKVSPDLFYFQFLNRSVGSWSPVVPPDTNVSLPTANSMLGTTTIFKTHTRGTRNQKLSTQLTATFNVVPHNSFNILTALTSTSSYTGHPVTTPIKGHVSHSSYTSPRGTNTTGVTVPSDPLIATKVLCISFKGRLGNQLFQYASLLGIALGTKRIPVYLGKTLLSDVLRNTSLIDTSSRYTDRCEDVFLKEAGCCKFFPKYFELDSKKDYRIGEYLQSWRYFAQHEAEVRHALTFKDTIMSQARQTVDALRQKFNRTLTGIHVRRGDFVRNTRSGYKAAPVEYLLHAMDYVRKRFNDVIFVVSSDDLKWCSQQFANKSDVTVLQRQSSPAVDMMILASLDHMIMTVGSYGWWASFLNPGITVYYRDFVNPGTPLSRHYHPNGTDYFCPDWISLS